MNLREAAGKEVAELCAIVAPGAAEFTPAAPVSEEAERWYELALHHGMMPAFAARAVAQEGYPAEQRAAWREAFLQNAARNMAFASELVKTVTLLREAGVEAIPFKGPLLAERAYGDLAMRQISDLDLFIRRRDFHHARAALREAGFAPYPKLTRMQERALLWSNCELTLRRAGGLQVELHWQLAAPDFQMRVDLDELWPRATTVAFHGSQLRAFDPADELVMLCIHASKHLWERLGWVLDVAWCARGPVDWSRVLHVAARSRSRRATLATLWMAHELFYVELPPEVLRAVERDPAVREVARSAVRQLASVPVAGEDPRGYTARTAAIQDSRWRSAQVRMWGGARRLRRAVGRWMVSG